ncbi:MAG: hypothetical protein DWH81_07585 [Planctomycetota bacterium]|nr:MAG: hypothetical protein DWH81_07585 [Planctomycetota bacterium]
MKRIADAILDITGVHVSCRVTEDQSSPAPAVEPASPVVQEVESRRKSSVDDDPFVQQAVEIFSAKVADVRTVLVGQPSDE